VIPVVTVAEMRAIDEEAHATVAHDVLVDRAGTAVAAAALRLLGGAYGRRVVVVAGKGSNGADGRVAASRLRRRGARVELVEASEAPDRIGPDGGVDLVIDAAYGTGFRGDYRAPSVPAGVPVLAVDIPSGVDGDTGEACGEPLRADVTVTFVALKPGLLQGDGPLLAGRVEVVDIGLDTGRARLWVVEDADVARLLPLRARGAYKWQSAVAVVAGSPGMTGAAELCAHAAYRAGAGMVRLGVPGADPALLTAGEAVSIELAGQGWAPAAREMVTRCHSLVVGPGLGRAEDTAAQVRSLVAGAEVPVVVDADGLVALGTGDEIAHCRS
jgi:NAD(P)H-hydrate repair Nnr-like enzyme with NAD(P)H-hydrate epimerase domain